VISDELSVLKSVVIGRLVGTKCRATLLLAATAMMGLELETGLWDTPTMRIPDETRIDDKCRTSALTGLVKPGERYKVIKQSDVEIRFVRMAIENPVEPKVRVVKNKGRKLLVGDRLVSNADTQKIMEQFP
jgi:hypothetical protein